MKRCSAWRRNTRAYGYLRLSPTLFSNVSCGGNCARALGVDGVLPKPVARDALIAAIRDLVYPRT